MVINYLKNSCSLTERQHATDLRFLWRKDLSSSDHATTLFTLLRGDASTLPALPHWMVLARRIARRPVIGQNERQVHRLARGRGDVTRTAFLTVAGSDWLSGGHLTRSTLIGRGPP